MIRTHLHVLLNDEEIWCSPTLQWDIVGFGQAKITVPNAPVLTALASGRVILEVRNATDIIITRNVLDSIVQYGDRIHIPKSISLRLEDPK